MSIPINAFDLAEKLIDENYILTIPVPITMLLKNTENDFISTTSDINKVYLGDLLSHLKKHIIKLQRENEELKIDLKTVTHNGSIREYCDPGYYDNFDAAEESYKIREKWFKKYE